MAVRRLAYSTQSLALLRDASVTNTMVDIIKDGPPPMLKKKPTRRVRNGAELFNDTHQAEYKSRGQQTADQVKRVHQHNQSYPVMYDELNRKRSMTRMSTGHIRSFYTANSSNKFGKQNKRTNTSRISKRKLRSHYYTAMNKACQYEVPSSGLVKIEMVPECSKKISQIGYDGKRKDSKKGSKVDIDRTSNPSISPFNSVVSLTNEPMVGVNYYS